MRILEDAASQTSMTPLLAYRLAQAELEVANLLPYTGGDRQEAIDLLLSAQGKLKSLVDAEPERAEYRYILGRTFQEFAQYGRVPLEKRDDSYRKAISEFDQALSSDGEPGLMFTIRVSLRYSLWGLSENLHKKGNVEEAITLGRRAIEIEKRLLADQPTTGTIRTSARLREHFLKLLRDNGHADEADAIAETLGPSIP
jgi:tetratricopeptide (TPR) repeat protein